MKNVMVANFRKSSTHSAKQYGLDKLTTDLKAQIENSLECGWDPGDIVAVTNFDFEHMGIKATRLGLNDFCLTGSKMFTLRELDWSGVVWIHDLDAWQTVKFDAPNFRDIGLGEYSKPKFNGGSVWVRDSGKDIIKDVCDTISSNKENREEPVLNDLLRGKYKDRTTTLNYTWNVGCSGFVKRYNGAEKPVKVVHFHPTNRIAWDTHARNRNGLNVSDRIPDRLRDLFLRYYSDVILKYTYEDERSPLEVRSCEVDRPKEKKKRRFEGTA